MMTEPLKPALAALLAIVYLAAWWAFGGRPPRAPAAPAAAEPVVWYGDLPESQRPELHLPQGWYLAGPGTRPPAIRPAPLVRPARAVPARPGRLRTRSS